MGDDLARGEGVLLVVRVDREYRQAVKAMAKRRKTSIKRLVLQGLNRELMSDPTADQETIELCRKCG